MKTRITFVTFLLSIICLRLFAQAPLVYNVENTGASCAPPPLLPLSQLPVIQPLPDPFLWANGSGRSTKFSDWECRRNEIKAQIENYEIGTKPPRPDSITASYKTGASSAPDTLRVFVTKNGKTLTLTSQVYRPAGSGPFPAIIGMNSPSGSVPSTVFTTRNIARITFNHDQVTTYGNPQLTNPYYQLYPDQNLVNAGQYSAWSWGVSRIIDGLELVQSSLPVDLKHIGVTGCSYAGKMALFAGAFDERIALTIAQESGGGGAPAWRVSHNIEPNGTVEKIDNTDYTWFRDSMKIFSGDNVYKLPEDHHELMAMIAPRALLATGNTDFTWLSNQANYVSSRATKEVFNTLGIGDRFGFYIDGGHNHCAVPNAQVPAMQAFVDKFLVGDNTVNTDTITVNPFPQLDYKRWYQWWGTGNPVLPPPPGRSIWMEAECAIVGSNWITVSDTSASNGKYVTVKSGLSSTATPPTGDSSYLVMPFTVDSAGTYNFVSRVYSPAAGDYSYWMKIDNGAYQTISSLLLSNGGFESGLTGWTTLNSNGATITADNVAADAHSGSVCMKVVNPTAQTGNQWKVQVSSATFPTTSGKQYVVSYWVRAASPNGSIRLSTGPTNPQYQADQTIGTSWQQVSWTITASLSSTTFLFDMGQVANTYYIDDASVKEVNSGGGNWQWVKLRDSVLSVGSHTISIGYRDGNPKLDKMLVTTFNTIVTDKGDAAPNCSVTPVCPSNIFVAAPSCSTPVAIKWTEPRDTFPASINLSSNSVLVYKGTFNGHGYYQSTDQTTWETARAAAGTAGAHLVTITSAAENNFIFTNLNQRNNSAWIGLYNTGTVGSFAWVTGEPLSYTNWIPGQPDNLWNDPTFVHEPYVHINGWADPALCRWNDNNATATANFIAEFDNTAYSYRQISGPANGSVQLPGVYNICYERTTNSTNTKDTCCFSITVTCNGALVGQAGAPASVTDLSKRLQVTAVPNPSNDFFRLQISGSNGAEKVSMQVSDITGRMIENRTGVPANQVLNFGTNLKAGVYFVQVTQGNSKAMVKVIKQ